MRIDASWSPSEHLHRVLLLTSHADTAAYQDRRPALDEIRERVVVLLEKLAKGEFVAT